MEKSGLKILLIEDNEIDHAAFKRLVKEENLSYDYTIVRSVKEAREVFAPKKFDLVLVDYLLGDGTAIDLLEFIKETPAIVVTGIGDEEVAVRAMKAGAYDYLTKDNDRNYLKVLPRTVENALGRKRAEEALRQEIGFTQLLQVIAVAANQATNIKEIVRFCLERFCSHAGWPIGHAYFPSTEWIGEEVPANVWHFERPEEFRDFREIVLGDSFRPQVGLPGQVYLGRKPAWLSDLNQDINLSKAAGGGLKFAIAFPVFVEKKVAAVLGFFSAEAVEPDQRLLEVMSLISDQLGCVISRVARYEQAEGQLKASLKEKEILLQEIHHRVKNNLQIVSSLLSLQEATARDKQALEFLKESQNRVKTIALIHEKLYQSKNFSGISFAEYVHGLAAQLIDSFGPASHKITLKFNLDEINLDVDTAIPCGLIVNELVSNALKHAFPDGRSGEIFIEFSLLDDGKISLAVRDNGKGLPKALDFRNTETLGLQLVNTLANQLKGTVELSSNEGTEFRIVFPA